MDERILVRRRSVNRQRGRRRISSSSLSWCFSVAGGAFLWLRSTDVFAVRQVVATATERVTREEIVQATSPAMGESLLKLSTADLEEALVQLPYVRSAEVYRSFPDSLEVKLVEYQPVARLLDQSGQVWLVAEHGPGARGRRCHFVPGSALGGARTVRSHSLRGNRCRRAVAAALPLAPLFASGEVGAAARSGPGDRVGRWVHHSEAGGGFGAPAGRCHRTPSEVAAAAETLKQCLQNGQVLEYIDVTVPARAAVKAK